MDAVEHDSATSCQGSEGCGWGVAFVEFGGGGDLREEGFAGNSEQQGAAGRREGRELLEKREVVLQCFPEADAGIEAEACGIDAERGEIGETVYEKAADIFGDIGIGGGVLHVGGCALHVHDNDSAIRGSTDGGHFRIGGETGDVVDDVGTGGERFAGDGRFRGVD